MPICNLNSLVRKPAGQTCTFVPAGTGDRIYVFDLDDPALSGLIGLEPDGTGFYDTDTFKSVLNQRIFPIDIKSDSGQVTSEKAEDQQGRTLTGTAVIDHNIDKFLAIDAAMGFMNLGVIIPMDSTKCYVIMSPYKRVKYSSNYDSGTTYDSDHGFTITFTVSPVIYGCPMVKLSSSDLNTLANTTDYSSKYEVSSANSQYAIIVQTPAADNGTLTVTYDGATTVESGPKYAKGKVVKVMATPASEKTASITFNGVVVDTGEKGGAVTWTTILNGPMTIGATFK